MKIPDDTKNLIKLLMDSELRWKAQYITVWHTSGIVEDKHRNTDDWEREVIHIYLPAAKNHPVCTPKKLYEIYTSKDNELTLGHIQTLFSLFEILIDDVGTVLYGVEVNASHFKNLKDFLEAKGNFSGKIKFVSDDEISELELAKIARNCYIHKGGKIDSHFIKLYEKARGQKPPAEEGDELSKAFPNTTGEFGADNLLRQTEDWHELIIKIVTKLKSEIEAI
jgi:hypothetical protein